jgi:hypothetical protein
VAIQGSKGAPRPLGRFPLAALRHRDDGIRHDPRLIDLGYRGMTIRAAAALRAFVDEG